MANIVLVEALFPHKNSRHGTFNSFHTNNSKQYQHKQ
jgi:hypothetical protein